MKYFIIATYLFTFLSIIYSQESPQSTPTLAPSKTPTIQPSPSETQDNSNRNNEQNTTNISQSVLENPFTQDDLELLVGNVQRPNGIVWYDGELYTACSGDWTLYRINDTTGSTITFVFGIKNGNSLLLEPSENGFDLWVPDSDSDTLWKADQNRSAPISINNQLITPWGIIRANEDSFLITNSKGNSIIQVFESGESTSILTGLRSPTGIAKDDSYIYFANGGSARRGIEWFKILEDGSYSEPETLVSGLQNTTNVILGNDGLLYFGYALGTRGIVGRIDPNQCRDGGCTNEDVEIVIFSDIPAPIAGLTLSDDMRLFLHSRFRPEIYWVQLPN